MLDAEALAELLQQRRKPGADKAAIDAQIHARFGCERAVMFTDLVGFSRSVEAFGIIHFLQLIHEYEAICLPAITAHGGRCLKREGDSMLAVFADAGAALDCAHAMVTACRLASTDRVTEERIELCIGLGWGSVLLLDNQEIWGAEVNAASKLGEETARGGEILVTDTFRARLPARRFATQGLLFGSRTIFRPLV
ncbi:adenylate/guanylate cyclase domain-containing protein [Chitinimonas sp. BJYL2]|uniref:adenylate/guanylate cyclase domain-containing protein n=1 Tax=Chitinimonas sp. BJYL2 TaxID=2976696 RepID=UPI0022B4A9A1|nr:adenylate/guanylate cyclase domain-containing protein [Chitinimonas sp. BJYL2]